MPKIKFKDITDGLINIHFENNSQLSKLVDHLDERGYKFGTAADSLQEIKYLGARYFVDKDNYYLSLDRTGKYRPYSWVCCGKDRLTKSTYEYKDIDWK